LDRRSEGAIAKQVSQSQSIRAIRPESQKIGLRVESKNRSAHSRHYLVGRTRCLVRIQKEGAIDTPPSDRKGGTLAGVPAGTARKKAELESGQ
jgi:hypothetical protein